MPKSDGHSAKATRKPVAKSAARPRAESAAGPAPLTKAKLVEHLNADLAKEFQALIQYVQHAAVITGPQYDAIRAELTIHSNEEHTHALSLSEQIDFSAARPASTWPPCASPRSPRRCSSRTSRASSTPSPATRRASDRPSSSRSTAFAAPSKTSSMVEEEHARDLQNALDL